MFWSPAVMTVSVTFCCAPAGWTMTGSDASASADAAASRLVSNFIEPSLCKIERTAALSPLEIIGGLLRICDVEMQRLDRQSDADRLADRQAPLVVDEEMVVADAHAVAPDA